MFDQIMQYLRQQQGGGLPSISPQQGPFMRNMGQNMGEFSDAIAAQPGNQMRGGDLWMMMNRNRMGQGQGGGMLGGGAQTFPASPPPQFQPMPMGTVPQNAMPGLGGLLGMYGQQPSTAIPNTQAMFQGLTGAPPMAPQPQAPGAAPSYFQSVAGTDADSWLAKLIRAGVVPGRS